MTLITQQSDLIEFMKDANQHSFLTVDTEFLREKTYYPKLCLIQIGTPDGKAAAIDPLSQEIDLAPILEMLANKNITKVFHAAKQDLEIFYKLMGAIPAPIFDTQIAAMVCGYGEQIGYEGLVRAITDHGIDKTSQFTDWSHRPLTDKQINYALGDVTHLVEVYLHLKEDLKKRGREHWMDCEKAVLKNPDTYEHTPEKAWERIKIKSTKPEVLNVLRAIARWREKRAQRKNVPRTWILKDDTLADIAAHPPKCLTHFKKIRGFPKEKIESSSSKKLLFRIREALESDPETWPHKEKKKPLSPKEAATVDILKMLLKVKASQCDVAAKVIAHANDLEHIAQDKPEKDIPALNGWRYDIFGKDAVALKNGEIALGFKDKAITIFKVTEATQTQ